MKRTWIGIDNELQRGYTGEKHTDGRNIYDPLLAAIKLQETARSRSMNITRTRQRNIEAKNKE
jgi:hypothetical protein